MPESYLIYLYFKQIMQDISGINATYNDMQTNKQKQIGINVSKPQTVSKRKLNTGEAVSRKAFITVVINCENSKEGILLGEGYLEKLRDICERTHNKMIYFKESELGTKEDYTDYLSISQIDLQSDVINLGKNNFDIPRKSLKVRINYIKGGH